MSSTRQESHMRGGDPLAGVLILKVQVKVLREEQGEQIEAQN